jgi:hypothetical protein
MDIWHSETVLTGHIRSQGGHVRRRPDISNLRVGHILSFRTVLLYQMSTTHDFFIGYSHLIPSTLHMISPIPCLSPKGHGASTT